MYQRGLDLEQAQRVNEWMYDGFWIREGEVNTLGLIGSARVVYAFPLSSSED